MTSSAPTTVNLQPLEDRVAIRPDAAVETTVGGIVVPDAAQEQPNEGVVVATGPHVNPTMLALGTRVVFPRYAGVELDVDGETLVVMRQGDVIATRAPKSALVPAS